ncbi:MAG: hypothetical protein Q9213_001077 [Squamulea squamosa]
MASEYVELGTSNSSDDDTISLTSTVLSVQKNEPYNLEAVLAERTINGKKKYLVKWEGYPHFRNTWERKGHLNSKQTLLDWRDQQMQITRGRAKAFDVDAWEVEVEKILEATKKRRARRREKKIAKGIPVKELPGDEPSEAASSSSSYDSSDDNDLSDASEGVIGSDPQSRSASPDWTPTEETALLRALQQLREPRWDVALERYGPSGTVNQALQHRTEKALHRKAVAMKKDFDASGRDFPVPMLLDYPLSNRSLTVSTSSGRKHATYRTSQVEPMSELVNALKGMSKPVSGTGSKAPPTSGSASPRKRKPDHRVSQQNNASEKLRIRVPARTTTATQGMASTKTLPASASPRLPDRPAILGSDKTSDLDSQSKCRRPSLPNEGIFALNTKKRPTQLGAVGRGPARKGFSAVKPIPNSSNQKVNVLGNWGVQPNKRRKSRYEMPDLSDQKAKQSGTFKKFSTQRKFDVAARYERTPDINSLTFVGLKDGKALTKLSASVARRPLETTPFRLLQESMKENQDEGVPLSNDALQPKPECSPLTESSINKPRLSKADSTSMNSIDAANAEEPTTPMRRASFPFETHAERSQSAPKPFAAPVAMMGSGQDQSRSATSSDTQILPQDNITRTPGTEEAENVPVDEDRGAVRRPGVMVPQQTEERAKFNSYSGSNAPQKIIVKPMSPEITDSKTPSGSASDKPVRSQTQRNFTPRKDPIVAEPQPILPYFQPQENGYALYPFDIIGPTLQVDTAIHNTSTDVIAEILTGTYGETTGAVLFKGLENFELKKLFLTIRVPPKQMHVKCKTVCTAGEYATFFHHGPNYFGSGHVVPFVQSMRNIDVVSSVLAEHASGGLFFAERFSLLIYPARCVAWEFLDRGFPPVPPDTKLRFAMFVPWPQFYENDDIGGAQKDDVRLSTDVQGLHINRVFRTQFGMDLHRLITPSSDKDVGKTRSTDTFFLLFPSPAREEFSLVVEWIRANKSDAIIYRHEDRGAWDDFHKSIENGVIICHGSFYDYWSIPYLAFALRKGSISMFSCSLEPMEPHTPDPHLIRIFPAGQAILLTDSLFILRPTEAARILSWFRLSALPTKPFGTWKVCTRPAIREWLLRLQEQFNYPHGKDFVRCYGEIMRLLPNELTKEWDRETPKDSAPVASMGNGVSNFDQTLGTSTDLDHQGIMKNDITLVNWFAGWAMMKQEKFRRFHVVTGRDEGSVEHKTLKDSAKKYNHLEIMTFEKFDQFHKMWNWSRIEREDEKRREEAAKADEELERKTAAKEQSPDLPDYEDDGMADAKPVEEESLFLPLQISSPEQMEIQN